MACLPFSVEDIGVDAWYDLLNITIVMPAEPAKRRSWWRLWGRHG